MKILLLSGGADSMLLLQLFKFDRIVFFDYGQKHLKKEYAKCKNYITDYLKLPDYTKKGKEVNCRNLSFIVNTVSKYGYTDIEIYIGTNAEDIYKDNSREFYNKVEKFINKISFNKVNIKTPLQKMIKNEILSQLDYEYYTD